MEWIKTDEKFPENGQKIEMTCKHWESNWKGNFSDPYIEKGKYDEFGNFWNSEGCRLDNPSYWRPYQPERSKREDFCCIYCMNFFLFNKEQTFCSCGKANLIHNLPIKDAVL